MKIDGLEAVKAAKRLRVRYVDPECAEPREFDAANYWQGYNMALTHVIESLERRMRKAAKAAKK